MERKSKEIQAKEGPTSLARTTVSPFAWLDDMDRWFDNIRRSFEDRFWGGPPRPVDRLRPARPPTPGRPDRQGFRVRGPGGTPRRCEGGRRPHRDRGWDRDPRGDEPLP